MKSEDVGKYLLLDLPETDTCIDLKVKSSVHFSLFVHEDILVDVPSAIFLPFSPLIFLFYLNL